MQRALPFVVFLIVLGASRILGAVSPEKFPNLSPLGALFFCGMAFYGWRGVILPLAAWLITYPVTNLMQGYSLGAEVLAPLLGFALMIGLACLFKKAPAGRVFVGSLLSAVLFYLVTNALSWLGDPAYAPKSLATLGQALWTGVPGLPPTWTFFRNALLGQAVFTGLFLFAHQSVLALPRSKSRRVPA